MSAKTKATVPAPYLDLVEKFWLRPIRPREATVVFHSLIDRDGLTEPEEDSLDLLTDLVADDLLERLPLRGVAFQRIK